MRHDGKHDDQRTRYLISVVEGDGLVLLLSPDVDTNESNESNSTLSSELGETLKDLLNGQWRGDE